MDISGKIEIKREELIECMKNSQGINRDVVKKSEELDQCLNDYYKSKIKYKTLK